MSSSRPSAFVPRRSMLCRDERLQGAAQAARGCTPRRAGGVRGDLWVNRGRSGGVWWWDHRARRGGRPRSMGSGPPPTSTACGLLGLKLGACWCEEPRHRVLLLAPLRVVPLASRWADFSLCSRTVRPQTGSAGRQLQHDAWRPPTLAHCRRPRTGACDAGECVIEKKIGTALRAFYRWRSPCVSE